MSDFTIAQLVGAIIGAVTAVLICGIIRLINQANDAEL